MSKPIGEPAGGNLERCDREIAGREKGGDDGHGDVLLLYPPEQVQAVHDAFDRDDVVDGVEREVSAKTGSIRGHVSRVSDRDGRLKRRSLTVARRQTSAV
jgi:hypothetical protein